MTTLADFNAANSTYDKRMKQVLTRFMQKWDTVPAPVKTLFMEELKDAEWFQPQFDNIVEMKANYVFNLIVKWKKENLGFPSQSYKAKGIPVGGAIVSARQGKNKVLAALLDAEYGNEWKETGRVYTAPETFFQLIVEWKKDNPGFPSHSYKAKGIAVGSAINNARQGQNKVLAALLDAEFGDEWKETRVFPETILQLIIEWKMNNSGFPPIAYKANGIAVGAAIRNARRGGNKAVAALLDAEFGGDWRETGIIITAPETILQLIVEWKKETPSFPPKRYKANGVAVGSAISRARQGKNEALAALLDAEYGDEWRTTQMGRRKATTS
jgi:hypothetical protein